MPYDESLKNRSSTTPRRARLSFGAKQFGAAKHFAISLLGLCGLASTACGPADSPPGEGEQSSAELLRGHGHGGHGTVIFNEAIVVERRHDATERTYALAPVGVEGPYDLVVDRGSHRERPESVKVWLNGKRVVTGLGKRGSVRVGVRLAKENRLEVRVEGDRGDRVQVKVEARKCAEGFVEQDDPGSNGCVPDTLTSTATIGPWGGELVVPGLRAVFPPGSVTSPIALTLSLIRTNGLPTISVEPSLTLAKAATLHIDKSLILTDEPVVAFSSAEATGIDGAILALEPLGASYAFERDHFSTVQLVVVSKFPPLPFPTLPSASSWIDSLVRRGVFGASNNAPPSPLSPCPCSAVAVIPPVIPRPGTGVFAPGQAQQLDARCGGNVTTSRWLPDPLQTLMSGMAIHWTGYISSDSAVAGVTQEGLVSGVRPGHSDIAVANLILRYRKSGFQLCPALGGAQVDVACPQDTQFCDGACTPNVCSGGRVFDDNACECNCPTATEECGGKCVSNVCSGGKTFARMGCQCECPNTAPFWNASVQRCEPCAAGTSWDAASRTCVGVCPADFELVPASLLSMGPGGTGGGGLLGTYGDGTVVPGEGPIWFGPHESGWVASYYPASGYADASAPALWQDISGLGSEVLTGFFKSPKTGPVELLIGCDDYCSVDIPGLISDVEDNTDGSVGGRLQLDAGTWYDLQIGYANRYGTNGLQFYYRCP